MGYVAHPFSILFTILLFVPMVTWQQDVVLILLLNSYMNVGSFSASQVTLREVQMTAGAQEERAQQDHEAILAEFAEIKAMHAAQTEELATLRAINQRLSERHERLVEGLERVANPKVRGGRL